MADKYNPGRINIDSVTTSILLNGGGINKSTNADGSTHTSVYSRAENRHLSYDRDKEDKVSNVHTDKNNRAYMDYKGGK